jgi:hypothetical protein
MTDIAGGDCPVAAEYRRLRKATTGQREYDSMIEHEMWN